ncbi:hypothetical protein EGW08_015062 [Elysia chlorotica]|uniref:Reverse transcriptase/retrotransposon-derived protein RNase H-like domain-containing protein n=1 Tax=Elysia chlorotica TaxID=188477 RepID=A0A3S1B7W2_ELYCH|nr:hypothetical protein EGW08_015062 [Elysia chlorotica]
MASQIPRLSLDWGKDNKQTAFQEWREFLDCCFVINKVRDQDKYHYILLSSGTKGKEVIQAANLTEETKKDPANLWNLFETIDLVKISCQVKADSPGLKVISIKDLHQAYPEHFDGIGSFAGKFHITPKDYVMPVVYEPRKYPFHLQKELKNEPGRMEALGVINKVHMTTDWINSVAFSRKQNGKLRNCLDPKDLKKAIKRTYHKVPTLEEISHKFSGATFFSKWMRKNDHTLPLRNVLHKDTVSQWTASHEQAFAKLKNLLHEDIKVFYFDPNVEIEVLLQHNKPFAFASKAHSETEQRYANTKRELLAVVFGCEKFLTYIIIWKTCLSEVRPQALATCAAENIATTPPRLQRMLLRISYDCTIEYKPGPEMILTNYMSRASPDEGQTIELESTIHTVSVRVDKLIPTTQNRDKEGPRTWPTTGTNYPRLARKLSRDTDNLEEMLVHQFIRIADYASKMFFVKNLTIITSKVSIDYFKSVFAVHGILDELITDNDLDVDDDDVDQDKNADLYAELIQVLDDRSLSLEMRKAENDGRKDFKILREHYSPKGTLEVSDDVYVYGKTEGEHDKNLDERPEMILADYMSRASPDKGQTIELESTIHTVSATVDKYKQLRTETKKDPELGPLKKQIIHGWPEKLSRDTEKFEEILVHERRTPMH